MATKNIYLFKAIIHDTQNNEEVPVTAFRHLFLRIFDAQCTNNALPLTYMDSEPMVLDIIDNTDNALFGGFLYTNYSLLIGLSDNKVMGKLKNTNIIEKRNHHIFNGILYATLSVIAGILLILYPDSNYLLTKLFYPFLQNSEIVFMVFLIIYFLLSLKEMNTLVNNISVSDNRISKAEIEEIRRKVVSEQKKNKCGGGDCN